jgi:hypothetical protein
MKTYAVLTGDIIGSSALGPDRLGVAIARLRELADEFDQVHGHALVGKPDVFRGDSWQLCLQKAELAVTGATFLRTGLRAHGFDSRIGIGLGPVDRLHEDRISESGGGAFVSSGRALDGLGRDQNLALVATAATGEGRSDEPALEAVSAALFLLDAHLSGWTQRECVAAYGSLRKLSQSAIAELPLARTKDGTTPTRQAIQDALSRIQWSTHLQPFLEKTLVVVKHTVTNLEAGSKPARMQS